jgi:hypothetical protein
VRTGQRGDGRALGVTVRAGHGRRRGIQLRQPEIEKLHALLRQQDVGRLQITVHDALAVRRVQGFANLHAALECLLDRQRTGDGSSLDVLHDEVAAALVLPDVVQRADVRVIERRDRPGLAFEPVGERALDGLHRHVAIETRVAGAIDVAHASRPEIRAHFVGADAGTRIEGHCRESIAGLGTGMSQPHRP